MSNINWEIERTKDIWYCKECNKIKIEGELELHEIFDKNTVVFLGNRTRLETKIIKSRNKEGKLDIDLWKNNKYSSPSEAYGTRIRK
ncbi:MAG: hypothetical protein ABEK17_03725 [Candidatus Aenigmatarchaeota archaeon]